MNLERLLADRMRPRLAELYGSRADACLSCVLSVCARYRDLPSARKQGWDERDVVLVTYADQVRSDQEAPLCTLRKYLTTMGLQQIMRVLHLLGVTVRCPGKRGERPSDNPTSPGASS